MRSESMDIYLREMRRHDVLDRDQEHELALRYRKTHSPAVAHRLAEGHLRLVVKVAREYAWSRQSLADLVQAGNMGLIRAIETFDPDRGVRLPTYAVWWIRACIVKMIVDNRRLVRIGTTARQRRVLANLRRERERLLEPGDGQGEGEVDAEALAFLRHAITPEVALDVAAPGHRATRLEELVSDEETRPDVQLENVEYLSVVRDIVRRFASRLHGREAVLFRERWVRPRRATLQMLGDRLGLSRERVRQIEARILERLRHEVAAQLDVDAAGRRLARVA
jgi:RNA polymerase sigma-32 factor